jgi:hypothetical protein
MFILSSRFWLLLVWFSSRRPDFIPRRVIWYLSQSERHLSTISIQNLGLACQSEFRRSPCSSITAVRDAPSDILRITISACDCRSHVALTQGKVELYGLVHYPNNWDSSSTQRNIRTATTFYAFCVQSSGRIAVIVNILCEIWVPRGFSFWGPHLSVRRLLYCWISLFGYYWRIASETQ